MNNFVCPYSTISNPSTHIHWRQSSVFFPHQLHRKAARAQALNIIKYLSACTQPVFHPLQFMKCFQCVWFQCVGTQVLDALVYLQSNVMKEYFLHFMLLSHLFNTCVLSTHFTFVEESRDVSLGGIFTAMNSHLGEAGNGRDIEFWEIT